MGKRQPNRDYLYPVFYKGKNWYEKDCAGIFTGYYICKEALRESDCSVYFSDNERVCPDGELVKQ